MKILIVGEFSGFSKHLKNGFRYLGHEVTVVQTGDGWKKLGSKDDIMLESKCMHICGHAIRGTGRFYSILNNLKTDQLLRRRCSHLDLIIVINYSFIRKNISLVGVSKGFINRALANGARLIMSECGDSCAGAYNSSDYYRSIGSNTSIKDDRFLFLLNCCSIVIPTCYSYYADVLAYTKAFKYDDVKISNAIPLPITVEENVKISSCMGRKIVVFHGIIRPASKGTPFILQAMKRLQEDYPENVECISCGGMAYEDYLKLFERVDILIDQCRRNGWGMNAEIGAMKGKCVLAPSGPENAKVMNISELPFIQIGPDSNQIYKVLVDLISDPHKIDQIKKASREFVEKYCDCKVIAQRYINAVDLNS